MDRALLALLMGLALTAAGCAREAPHARAPDPTLVPWLTPPGYAWPPRTVAKESRLHPGERAVALSSVDPVTSPFRTPLASDTLIPGGEACIDRLRERGLTFEPLPLERGVETPILVHGAIGGVQFWSTGGPMVVDCRMALALDSVAGEFLAVGISRVRFSGAYVYRTSKKGRLSLHAYGLALDVHEATTAVGTVSVKQDFSRGLSYGCATDAPVLNQLACRLRARGLFRELLTPDYDADHQDHLHLGLAPLPGQADRMPSARASTGESRKRSVGAKASVNPRLASAPKPPSAASGAPLLTWRGQARSLPR